MSNLNMVKYVDSHTAGEPTRIVTAGGPDLGTGSIADRLQVFSSSFDWFRSAVVNEPRGWNALVGGLVSEPTDPKCSSAAIFFNNVGFLGMCGHAMMGLAVTMHHLGKLDLGKHWIETPVGLVAIELKSSSEVVLENVASYRWKPNVVIEVESIGTITGDIVWGGNWFFLVKESPIPVVFENIDRLMDAASKIRTALEENGISAAEGAQIDHVEFFGAPVSLVADSKNFVLCPGRQYDRSPCGTGTSAKLACLAAEGILAENEVWIQESIIGSQFRSSYQKLSGDKILPKLIGSAYVCSQGQFVDNAEDPFRFGIGRAT